MLALLGLEFVNKGYIEEVYGKIFAKNMQLREKADYDVSFRASEEEAKSMIDDANRFLNRIKKAIEDFKKNENENPSYFSLQTLQIKVSRSKIVSKPNLPFFFPPNKSEIIS